MQPISRAEAKSKGLTQYFTGKPCKHGHVAYRYVQSGTCSQCIAESTERSRRQYAAAPARNHAPAPLPPVAPRMAPVAAPAQSEADLLAELVEVRVRATAVDAQLLRTQAQLLTLSIYPGLSGANVAPDPTPTDAHGGTALYRLAVPVQCVGIIKATAAALLEAHAGPAQGPRGPRMLPGVPPLVPGFLAAPAH